MRDRIKEIKSQNFASVSGQTDTPGTIDFSKIKVGSQTLSDAVLDLNSLKDVNSKLADRNLVLKAIAENDLKTMREISDFFYRTSSIYARILRYMAFMYRYDWYVTPIKIDDSVQDKKLLEGFKKSLSILDNYNVKKQFGEIALKILKNGCYYGYKIPQGGTFIVQELPTDYCRSRYIVEGSKPVVEFNMKFFDDKFRDSAYRIKILKLFPAEFSKGYMLYKQGKLPKDFYGDTAGWYMLDPSSTIKFNANGEDSPLFISVIPLIIDLVEAQELNKKKAAQKLLKLVIQQLPLDKNGEMIFDPEEAQQFHNNAVWMLSRAIGLDVLTTFADVKVESMSDSNATNADNEYLESAVKAVYTEAGVSQMQFNTDGNLALEKSVLNDEACMYNMILQFEDFLNDLIDVCNKNKKVQYKAQILNTTIYNYKEMAKLYKEQMQVGFSKMLPQIALGQSQSSILASAYFENEILDLVNVFIPPLMSSTMNADILNRGKNAAAADGEGAGRKELPNDQKSEKTIQNQESAN